MVEFVVLDFPGESPGAAYASELRRLAASGTVRILDALLVRKSHAGVLEIVDPAGGLIGDEDVDDVAAELAPGHTAVVLVIDHAWEGGARHGLRGTGGRVILATPAMA
jgi:uncharacterized membrane protein